MGTNANQALTSKVHAERVAALEARKREIATAREATLAELQRKATECRRTAEADEAEADRVYEATASALDEARAKALAADLAAPVVLFAESPRLAAGRIAEVFTAHHAALQTETGEELSAWTLGYAFARAHGVQAKAGPSFWSAELGHGPGDAAHAAAKAILDGGHVVEVEAKLRALEVAIAERARQTPHPDAAAFEAIARRASQRRTGMAVAAYREERTAAHARADQARPAQAPAAAPAESFDDVVRAARREARKADEAQKRAEDARIFGG